MSKPLKKGDRVAVYQDPVTRKDPEGAATLLKRGEAFPDGDLERWWVEFDGERGAKYERWVSADCRLHTFLCERCPRQVTFEAKSIEDAGDKAVDLGWRIEIAYSDDADAEDLCPQCYSQVCNNPQVREARARE